MHLFTNGRYGYFRDELYMLACGEHLAWGYVDHAPLIALIARLSRAAFGDSLHGIRLLPALASAAKILLTGLIARELGARRFGVTLACLCVLVAPIYLGIDTILTMNAFEPLFWMGCAYLLLLAIKQDRPQWFLWFGIVAGVGLENKHSMLFFGFALVAGLLLTPERRLMASRWFWIGGVLAAALFLPNILWQISHHWPTLEDLNNVRVTHKDVELGPLAFLAQQVFIMLPISVIVWGAGLWYFLFDGEGKRYRALGFAYLILLALMIALHGKNYYMAPAYPMLFAAGGVFWEQTLHSRVLRTALAAAVLLMGIVAAPLFLPVLPVDTFLRYEHALGVAPPKTEVAHSGPLPQLFGDMFGWEEMVATVAQVYHALPPAERARAAIFAGNYGEAGAIDLFGPRYGLPKAISTHQTYYLWGPRGYTGDVMILLQWSEKSARRYFRSVEAGPVLNNPYAMGEEHYTIFIGRGLKQPLVQLWPQWKHWN